MTELAAPCDVGSTKYSHEKYFFADRKINSRQIVDLNVKVKDKKNEKNKKKTDYVLTLSLAKISL